MPHFCPNPQRAFFIAVLLDFLFLGVPLEARVLGVSLSQGANVPLVCLCQRHADVPALPFLQDMRMPLHFINDIPLDIWSDMHLYYSQDSPSGNDYTSHEGVKYT